ncbi:sel1 repeat family protein [Pantoea sp. Tr-811]|uniref:sel1 repeat family protein n=1 Tax=unclassified Pantoea TaxID=2630326 RepID=UPI0014209F78|nr:MULTISPECIES: sel1 repeat family protein [unclassified Pantoea]NIE73158.1 sel1 repeat family protein [Pantoea sp. Ap-967]NIF28494.1 sel1 repeat family protein [Pantoea sp. Tr-811]
MSRAALLPALFIWLAPIAAQALEVRIDPHADLLYRQALPLLEQADNQDDSNVLRTSLGNDPELNRQGQAMARTLPSAVALLKKSVELGHPVAQYRLALYYTTYLPVAQIADAACPLLEASLKQGFAPPATAIATWCKPYNASPAYRQALEAIPSMATLYAAYYPQPAARLSCNRSQPQGLEMQWGRQRDYQAEVYRLLGDLDPQHRQSLLQKAVDINGCESAQQRLTSQR